MVTIWSSKKWCHFQKTPDIISGNVCNSASPWCLLLKHLELSGPRSVSYIKIGYINMKTKTYEESYESLDILWFKFRCPKLPGTCWVFSHASKEQSPTFLATAAPGGAHHYVRDVVKLVPLPQWYHGLVRWKETELSSCVLRCFWVDARVKDGEGGIGWIFVFV